MLSNDGVFFNTSKAIPKLNFNTVTVIVKDLLLSLPSYHEHSPRGQILLGMLLEKIKPCLDHDLHSRKPAELTTARPYLQLAGFIVLESKTAFSCDLLQYYCNTLIGKMFLQKLEVDDRLWVIHNLADVLAFCKEYPENDERFMPLRSRIVEACPFLLEVCVLFIHLVFVPYVLSMIDATIFKSLTDKVSQCLSMATRRVYCCE